MARSEHSSLNREGIVLFLSVLLQSSETAQCHLHRWRWFFFTESADSNASLFKYSHRHTQKDLPVNRAWLFSVKLMYQFSINATMCPLAYIHIECKQWYMTWSLSHLLLSQSLHTFSFPPLQVFFQLHHEKTRSMLSTSKLSADHVLVGGIYHRKSVKLQAMH